MIKKIRQRHGAARGWAATNCLAGLAGAGLLLLAPAAQAQTANALSGAYTINSAQATAGTNFASFADAASRLNTDGVSGPVTITVSGGPYTEQFLLGEVAGTSATNLLVINGGGRTIQFASANNAQRAVVQLNGTDYTTINNLVINAASGTYGCGILLTNMANNDKLTNNVITTDVASTSVNFAGIATSGSTSSYTATGVSANNLLIEGNTITGGYYSIGLYGNTTAAPNTGNIVRNNVVKDFYVNGIYLGFQEGTLIVGNDVSRPTRTTVSGFNGIYAFGTSRGLSIEKNRIHDPFTGAPASTDNCYPIFLATSTGATASNYNDVVNNVIYNLNGAGPQYGVYNSSAAFVRIYNNSISAEDQNTAATSTTYGIYTNGASNDVRNNVVRITRTGTGNKYGLYYATNAPVSNYNDVYVPSGNVGYYTTAYPALNNWQTANGGVFDQNSLSVDPQYVDATTGNLLPANVALNNAGTPLSRVADDIMGAVRGAVPDMGAYEFTPVPLDLAPMSLLSPATSTTCYGTAEAVTVQVRSGGTVPLDFAANAITVTVVVTPPTGAAQTFTTTLTSGTLASGGTRNVTLPGTLDMSALGTYTFAVTATVAGDQNPGNDLLVPTPTRTAVAPVAGTLSPATNTVCRSGTAPLSLSGSANGSVQYQSSASASGPFTDVAGATSASYTTPVLTSTTYYRVRTTCNANTVYSNVATITVSNPQLVSASSSPQTVCAGSTATLSGTASAGSSVRFYSAATGGTPLVSTAANTATTPALTASTTFYAEAYSGSVERVGPASNSFGFGSGTNSTNGLIFTNNTVGVLTSVSVYPTVAGVSNIQLLNSAGIVLQVYQATFTASDLTKKTVVPLNFPLPAATGLQLQLLNAGSTASLYRNTTAAVYPYTSPSGQISITGNTLATSPATYFYFYDWEVNTECPATTRTAVPVSVTPAPATPTLTASPQANGTVLLTASSTVSGASYQFYANGAPVGPASTSNTLTLQSGSANGSYTVALTSGGCASAQSAAVAVTVTGTRATASLAGVSLRVYPTPTPDGQLTLELAGPKARASMLTVVNGLGQVVLTQPVAAGTSALRLSSLAAGVYVLRVQTPEGVLTQRVVRE